ncbi:2-hydroxycyclohexane-1-carbonyl-CoA dehydrogenase [Mycolicibacterium murale]|uniref:3-oxoacyl-[acyl-carrier-protein] reductase MabA n=1 Tax=Mycolicibacterium murale TaxID=182220 RepID=A0A7I9WX46_9MYCO|nr:SDR family NAD(P)-dependent oxidoreductase [Mycolicibacterium murale]MCV7182003.1 SDR family oxidoreductase [Mycolicibacterium murale]GFG62303.1 2-hydroxycyclohexane-1-carbonyl-CoA dehydrogenase [Mycolicibacterium murale]
MTPDLTGRTAIVTGAARGIGRSIAETLADNGATVVIADLEQDDAEKTARSISETGGTAVGFGVDVTDAHRVEAMVAFAESLPGSLDVLVNNAGTTSTATVENTDETDWRRVLEVNLTGAFLCSKAVLPGMRVRTHGRIINVASIAAKRISFNSGAAYTASKAGLLGFTRHLAYEAAPHGINVNAVCPGPVATDMVEHLTEPTALEQRLRNLPAGRFPTPQDQAHAVLFLVSDAAQMIFGQALDVDGGSLLGWYDTETYNARRTPAHSAGITAAARADRTAESP